MKLEEAHPAGEASTPQLVAADLLDVFRPAYALPVKLVFTLRWLGKNDDVTRAIEELKAHVEVGVAE